ncbi:uncharacterized protein BT62DRAFT_1011215 [Guyanagaster necrorhizus]|uniref:Uncharacterized protein n=1 Tax=Guyanagaster necrorhizus TaxID=856835 RepID=A0A9P7VL28_9AGAR|nr:uncharacterized protein BT62DRAFT_1011215 [Guyanagaster necrorhizus MCA 3950]KAG7441884.1 hypothetical protein BT62DRAFT_1011215 [Guyanagaster necrorhizus MCA 3950]
MFFTFMGPGHFACNRPPSIRLTSEGLTKRSTGEKLSDRVQVAVLYVVGFFRTVVIPIHGLGSLRSHRYMRALFLAELSIVALLSPLE